MNTVKDRANDIVQWASSGSKLTYAAVGTGILVGLILFKLFFKSFAGFFHSIGFSVGSSSDPAVAAQPGLCTSSRLKLLFVLLVPAGVAYAAYVFLPTLFPTVFR